jgi:hypothetical protein
MEEQQELINEFYIKFENKKAQFEFLDLEVTEYVPKEQFLDNFIKYYNEIRGNESKMRHFIIMKVKKIVEGNENRLPLVNSIKEMSQDIVDDYWFLVHKLFILLEDAKEDKNETVINTISIEIKKRLDLLEEKAKEITPSAITKKLKKKFNVNSDNVEIPTVDGLLSGMGSNPHSEKINGLLNQFAGGSGNIDGMIGNALNENPDMADMIKTLIGAVSNPGDAGLDILGLIKQFIPDVDTNCKANKALINKMYKDFRYMFDAKNDSAECGVKDRIVERFGAYRNLISEGKIQPGEVLSCLWSVAKDEEMSSSIRAMDKSPIDFNIGLMVLTELLPKEFVENFDLSKLTSLMGGNDVGGLLDMFGNMGLGSNNEAPDTPLTEEQMIELEKYYDEHAI